MEEFDQKKNGMEEREKKPRSNSREEREWKERKRGERGVIFISDFLHRHAREKQGKMIFISQEIGNHFP